LSDRAYQAFFDTASVEAGVNFQDALWSRMADVDLLILLDTPNALSSDWVHQELNRAHDLGMAVVQLIWPGHKPRPGTEFSVPLPLNTNDFKKGDTTKDGMLESRAISRIVDAVEGARIRSLNSRRTRVVDMLTTVMSGRNLQFVVHPAKHLDVLDGQQKLAEVVPFVGVPDSKAVHDHDLGKQFHPTVVIYNGLGVDQDWADHIKWLKQRAAIDVLPTDDFGTYLQNLP
jgi:hypothetical protein